MIPRNKLHVLMYPESTTPTPSGSSSSGDGEQRLPPGSSVPTERNDGKAEDNAPSNEAIDWAGEAEGDGEPQDEGSDEPPAQQPPAQQPPAQQPGDQQQQQQRQQEQPPAGQRPDDKTQQGQPPADEGRQPGEGEQQPAAQETPEQKTAREAKEAEERQRYEQELEEYYKIPDDLAARLATEPEAVLPKLASKVHQAVIASAQQYVAQMVPQILQQVQAVQEANKRSMDAFYTEWPGLRKYEKQVLQVGKMYRQMNPKAKPEEAIPAIGKLVCGALNMDPAKFGKVVGQPPAGGNGSRPPQRGGPPRPAAAGGSQAGAAPPSTNEWVEYAEDLLEQDQQE